MYSCRRLVRELKSGEAVPLRIIMLRSTEALRLGGKSLTYKPRYNYATEAARRTLAPDPVDTKADEAYQTLPKSSLPTYYFQKSLPRLPVPKLELTAQRYLDSAKCILTPEEFTNTENIVKEFQGATGLST
jgi:hypothetical protein